MVDFSKLLAKKALEAPEPMLMPDCTLEGQITKYELTQNRMKPPQAVLRLHLKAYGWPEEVAEGDRIAGDITKKRFERDYSLDEEARPDCFYYVDQLLRSCGIVDQGKQYDELFPSLNGAPVKFTLKRNTYEDKTTHEMKEIVNVTTVVGQA